MNNARVGRIVGRLNLTLANNQTVRRNINIVHFPPGQGPPVIPVPEDILQTQLRVNNQTEVARRRAARPPVYRHVVSLRIPVGMAFTRGNILITYLLRIARWFFQRDIGVPQQFAQCEATMPNNIYTAFNIQVIGPTNRNIIIPFGIYQNVGDLRNAFAVNYANQNMEMVPEDQQALQYNADHEIEQVYVEITMVHPSEAFQYNTRGRGRNALDAQTVIDGVMIQQREVGQPEGARPARRNVGLGNGNRRRGGVGANNARPGIRLGGVRARGHEMVVHPNGVLLVNRENMIDKLFTKRSAAIRDVPIVPEDVCIFMAFISSQCISYDFSFNKEKNQWTLEDVVNKGPSTLQQKNRSEETILHLPEEDQQKVRDVAGMEIRYFFLDSATSSQKRNWWLRLFNTYNPKNQEISPHEKEMWTLAALLFEKYIKETLLQNYSQERSEKNLTEEEFLEEFDLTDICQVCQILSDLFDLYISVYDLSGGANRFYGFMPQDLTPIDFLNKQYHQVEEEEGRSSEQSTFSIKMVNLLYDRGHMHGITNIHAFHAKENSETYRKFQYCPFCESVGGSRFRNKEDLNVHFQKECCLQKALSVKSSEIFQDLLKTQACHPAVHKFQVDTKCKEWCCYRCHEAVYTSQSLLHHVCKAEIRGKKKERISKQKIFSYDFEAAQIDMESLGYPNQFYHVCNCVCMIPAYYQDPELQDHPDKDGKHFHTENDFLDHLFDSRNEEIYKDALFFAHNGGSYDVTFILRYLENNRRSHTWLPRPGSHHKFISVTDTLSGITFLDFRMFMSGSLSSIADSMKLPISKGIFPHTFNNGEHTFYEGAVPPLHSEKDWWNLKWAKNSKVIEETIIFHQELSEKYCTCEGFHCCSKPFWSLQEQMILYCMLDVKLLAQCVVGFRTKVMELVLSNCTWENWKPTLQDPYWYVTTPQLCQAMLLKGFLPQTLYSGGNVSDYCEIVSVEKKRRLGQTVEALQWLNSLPNKGDIYHRGNWHREYFSLEAGLFADGYDEKKKTAYVCLDCNVYACESCYQHTDLWHSKHPVFTNKTYAEVNVQERAEIYTKWQLAWGGRQNIDPVIDQVYIRKQCDLREQYGPLQEYHQQAYEIGYNGIDCMKGGRTEVFKVLYEKGEDPGETINYDDVCSLYPYVCAFREMPLGVPQYILGENINKDRLFHRDKNIKYWGFIHCKVKPNKQDLLGLLPNRRKGQENDPCERLMFTLEDQIGTWFTEELEFALHHGYDLVEVYNIFHWDTTKRSDMKFRPYVDCFIKLKQQSEKWSKLGASSDYPSEEEKNQVAQKLFESNGFIGEIDTDLVEENPVMRALMKLFLNNMWGKWAQKDSDTVMCTIYGAKQFYALWNHPMVEKTSCSFREICPETSVYKAQIGVKGEYQKNSGRTNYFIGGAVTAHARIILHTRMVLIGPERMIYCDTDSVIYKWHKSLPVLTSQGLGQWEKEKGKPIKRVLAIAPKFYILEFEDEQEPLAVKSKGVIMTVENKNLLTKEKLLQMIFSTLAGTNMDTSNIYLQNFAIRTNTSTSNNLNFYVMCSIYNSKVVKMNITKREIVVNDTLQEKLLNHDQWSHIKEINTVPIGFELV